MSEYHKYGSFASLKIPKEIDVYFFEIFKGEPNIKIDDEDRFLDDNQLIVYERDDNNGILKHIGIKDLRTTLHFSKSVIQEKIEELLKENERETEKYVVFWLKTEKGSEVPKMTISNNEDLENRVFNYYSN